MTDVSIRDPLGAWTIARLLCGEPIDGVNVAALSEPYGLIALNVSERRNGKKAEEVFAEVLAELKPDIAREIREAVFAADPQKARPRMRGMSAEDLLKANLPPLRWAIQGLIPRPGVSILGGAPKAGKSWMSLQIARALSMGESVLMRVVTEKGRVLYYALEDGPSRLQGRIRQAGWTGREDVIFLFGDSLPPLDDGGLVTLESDILAHKPVLVVLDSLAAAKTGRLDENDGGQIAELMYAMSRMSHNYDLSLLIVHHHRKMTTGSPLGDLRGSGAIGGAADAIMALYRERGESESKLGLDSRDAEGGDWTLGFTGCGWTFLGGPEIAEQKKSERNITRALKTLGLGGTLEDVIREVGGMRRQDALNALQGLVDSGAAECEDVPSGGGRPRRVYRFIGQGGL